MNGQGPGNTRLENCCQNKYGERYIWMEFLEYKYIPVRYKCPLEDIHLDIHSEQPFWSAILVLAHWAH